MLKRRFVRHLAAGGQRCYLHSTAAVASSASPAQNEPILAYRAGSDERKALDATLKTYLNKTVVVPLVINGKEEHSNEPYNHAHKVAQFSWANKKQINAAIETGIAARNRWDRVPLKDRAAVFTRAADLAAGKYRAELNATTMIGQAKTIVQAEIDSACELIDFFRFAVHHALELDEWSPISTKDSTNRMIYRAMEGFVASISPFNFTAIGGNLAATPTLMGNCTVWKPSDTALLSNYIIFKILREAGLPDGVCQFVPADGPVFGDAVTSHRSLAAINFTGSVPTFQWLWKAVAGNLNNYVTFPRLIGECGGKNFHFVHSSADLDTVAPASIRSAFEYQGQKCSAVSRMYVPQSLWPTLKAKLLDIHARIKVGPAHDSSMFMSAVIDAKAFKRISGHITRAKNSAKTHEIIAGGTFDDSVGYYVQPTIMTVKDPEDKIMKEEIFGPVLPIYIYADAQTDRVLESIKDATPFGLTGAVFAQDKTFLYSARDRLRDAVGNLYLNDKCTGSVVGQQPFGGARMSGTNDKAGGPHYNLRWSSPQTIKETHVAQHAWRYPYMDDK